jgi:hypothetical protein
MCHSTESAVMSLSLNAVRTREKTSDSTVISKNEN